MELFQDTHTWFLISFLIFLVIAFKFGKSAVLQLLDSRIEEIRKNIESAEGLRVEAQELLAQYQRKHKEAEADAKQIIDTAKKQAKDIRKSAEAELAETIERREKQLQERLDRMQQSAKEEMRAYAANLAMTATSEIIAQQLDKKTNENLVDASIKEIGKAV